MPATHATCPPCACKRCGQLATPDLGICRSCLKLLRASIELRRAAYPRVVHTNPVSRIKPYHWAA
jgi:hypothetical protein